MLGRRPLGYKTYVGEFCEGGRRAAGLAAGTLLVAAGFACALALAAVYVLPASDGAREDFEWVLREIVERTQRALATLDAETGQELYSSKDEIDDWTHLSSITVADGSVYVTTRKTIVYAFGLNK